VRDLGQYHQPSRKRRGGSDSPRRGERGPARFGDSGGKGVTGEELEERAAAVWRERVGVEEDAKGYLHPDTLLL
jgi:hypothetical protein